VRRDGVRDPIRIPEEFFCLAASNSGAHCGQDQAGYDVMAEFSKWLEAGEESIFSLETGKTCQVHPTNRLQN
jgi:hypothetical protein